MDSSDRPLAYVQIIQDIKPIIGADMIEVAQILGWQVVVKKGLYKPKDHVVFVEIDAILPKWDQFKADKLEQCKFRIKTVILRKQISQGYCIPIPSLINHPDRKLELTTKTISTEGGNLEVQALHDVEANETITLELNKDLTSFLGIKKYEIQNAVNINGRNVKTSDFPTFFPKTDQMRIQNIPYYPSKYGDVDFEVTEKLEGSSITAFFNEGKFGICSRNFELHDESGIESDSIAIKTLYQMKIPQSMEAYGKSMAMQGELIGPGIQLNCYGLEKYQWKVFDIYLITEKRYATSEERLNILRDLGLSEIAAPIIGIKKIGNMSVGDILSYAEGASGLKKGVQREGIVFKSCQVIKDRVVHFKVISNAYEIKKAKDQGSSV